MYKPSIKGKTLKKSVRSPIQPMSYAQDIESISNLVYDLRLLREDIINTTDHELEKIDAKIAEIDAKLEYAISIQKGDPGEDADEQKIADWVLSQIRQPKDGKDSDPEAVIKEVLARLPKYPNEKELVASILKQLPSPTASLKIIKEELSLDKEALLDEILKSPKFKLGIDKIDGLKRTLDILDRRYIHGGGDTVSAGTNITITNVNGTKQINATGGSVTVLDATGTIDDSNVTFTFTSAPTLVVVNGSSYASTSTIGGTLAWTAVGTTVTLAFPVGTGGSIYGL